jgi:hypothetical protein
MRIALVSTVRNEEALLRNNVLYHRYLGVDEFYVYADHPQDRSLETVADLPFVHPRSTVPAAQYAEHPAFQPQVANYRYVPSRQVLNAFDAIERARGAGVDWLIHLDPDELICLDTERTRRGHLRERLAGIGAAVEMVWFSPIEIVQTGAAYTNVFAEAVLFKRPTRSITRKVIDPMSRAMVSIPSFYGHVAGKSGVRLGADVRPAGPHRFSRMDGRLLRARTIGLLLHYFAYDFRDFYKKLEHMKTQADVMRRGGQRTPQKRLWKAIMNEAAMSRDALEDYYRQWVVFSPPEVERWRRRGRLFGLVPLRRPALVQVRSVQRAWSEIG